MLNKMLMLGAGLVLLSLAHPATADEPIRLIAAQMDRITAAGTAISATAEAAALLEADGIVAEVGALVFLRAILQDNQTGANLVGGALGSASAAFGTGLVVSTTAGTASAPTTPPSSSAASAPVSRPATSAAPTRARECVNRNRAGASS